MRDRVKRMLGFVLIATVGGPPRSPRQTHFSRSRLQSGFGDHYRWPLTSISFVMGGRHGHGDSFPKCRHCRVSIEAVGSVPETAWTCSDAQLIGFVATLF